VVSWRGLCRAGCCCRAARNLHNQCPRHKSCTLHQHRHHRNRRRYYTGRSSSTLLRLVEDEAMQGTQVVKEARRVAPRNRGNLSPLHNCYTRSPRRHHHSLRRLRTGKC